MDFKKSGLAGIRNHCLNRLFSAISEGRFALVLARNRFSDIQLEYSGKGSDIKVKYNRQTIYFEVTRSRPNEEDKQLEGEEAQLICPSVVCYILEKKIQAKLSQLEAGEINIVVLCSETVRLGRPDVQEAFKHIEQKIGHNMKYGDMSALLFAEGHEPSVDIPGLQSFCLFKNDKALKPIGSRLTRKLESLYYICKQCGRVFVGVPPPNCPSCNSPRRVISRPA